MSSQIAALFARLGFEVDSKGLGEFEKKLDHAAKKIHENGAAAKKSGEVADKATNKSRRAQNKLYQEVKQNYAKIRVDRERAQRDLARVNDSLTNTSLPASQKQELQDAKGRVQQKLDDLVKREKAAEEAVRKNATREAKRAEAAKLREQKRRLAEEARAEREAAKERRKRRAAMERRDEQAHKARTDRARERQRMSATEARVERRRAAEQARAERQANREKLRQRSLMEKRDYEAWRIRGERLRQERSQERRAHQARMREATSYNRARNSRRTHAGTYRGMREYGRAWIPGIGGAFAAMQSTQSYQGAIAMEQGLTAATGSKEVGQGEMQWLIELAEEMGVFVGDLASDYAKFAASTVGTSVTLEEQREIFKGVSSMVRVLNMSADDAKGTFRALSQMMSNSQIMAQELQLQMGDRMPGAIQAMARAALKAGIITEKAGQPLTRTMKDAMADGKLIAEDILPYFARELWELANRGDAYTESIQSTSAALGRFRTNVWLANKTLNEAGYDKTVRSMMNRTSESINRSVPFWELLGASMVHLGNMAEGPIELFGAINERLPAVTEYVKENAGAFKILAAGITMAVAPLRTMFLLFVGIQAISDLLLDPSRERSFAEWAVQIGFATAGLGVMLGLMFKAVRAGKLMTGVFKRMAGIGTVRAATGSIAGAAAGSATGSATRASLVGALAKTALKVTVIGFAADALASLVREVFGDPNKSYSENLRDWGDHSLEKNREWREDPESVGTFGALGESLGNWWEGIKQADQTRRGNGRSGDNLLNDETLDAWLARSNGLLNDSNLDAYLASQKANQQEPTRQFIGDVNITVESPDPEMAGYKVEEAFQNIFSRELRITSVSQQVVEK